MLEGKFDTKLLQKPTYARMGYADNDNVLWFELPLETIHFFSLNKDAQLEEISNFVKISYKEAEMMKIRVK